MQISFNPTSFIQSTVKNSSINSKMDFIKKYGNYSVKYDDLTPLGEQKKVWFYFIMILSLILTGILFHLSREEKDVNGNVLEQTTDKKLYKVLAYGCLGIFVLSLLYSGYMYLFIYSPQYNEWFKNLPSEAQNQLYIFRSLDMIANESYNYTRNNPSLININ